MFYFLSSLVKVSKLKGIKYLWQSFIYFLYCFSNFSRAKSKTVLLERISFYFYIVNFSKIIVGSYKISEVFLSLEFLLLPACFSQIIKFYSVNIVSKLSNFPRKNYSIFLRFSKEYFPCFKKNTFSMSNSIEKSWLESG